MSEGHYNSRRTLLMTPVRSAVTPFHRNSNQSHGLSVAQHNYTITQLRLLELINVFQPLPTT